MDDKPPADGIRNPSIMYNVSMKSFLPTKQPCCSVIKYDKNKILFMHWLKIMAYIRARVTQICPVRSTTS